MYSEALAIMDRNTIQLTLEAELSDTKEQIVERDKQLADKDNLIANSQKLLLEKTISSQNNLPNLQGTKRCMVITLLLINKLIY